MGNVCISRSSMKPGSQLSPNEVTGAICGSSHVVMDLAAPVPSLVSEGFTSLQYNLNKNSKDLTSLMSFEGLNEQPLNSGVFGLGGVEEREDTVSAGEFSGRHVCTFEDIPLLHPGNVEQDWEANRIKQNHNLGVFGYERTGRHVTSEHTGFILLLSTPKELVGALVVEEIVAVGDRPEERHSVAAGDFPEGKVLRVIGGHFVFAGDRGVPRAFFLNSRQRVEINGKQQNHLN
nr:hypothetical protein Iba_chr10fCG3680 [Ipomoea batatas]